MALIAGGRDLVDRFVMQKTAAIQTMRRGRQDHGRVICHPALTVTLIAGGFALQTAHQICSMAVLAVAFCTLRGSSMGDSILIDGMTPDAADSLVLDAAGCENEAKPD